MIKKFLLFFLIFYFLFNCINAVKITPYSQFSLLTNTPGIELYSIFGHCAFRFKDSKQNIDMVFNYGTFDFNTPNFYIKFIKGKLNYFLSIESYSNYLWSREPMQTAYEQVLNLTDAQKQKLLDYLLNNYLPENRYYAYDFFFDNCATRLRDVMKSSLGEDVNFDYFQPEEEQSFRDLVNLYIDDLPWINLGINILLGLSSDKIAKPIDYFFLPEYVMEAFAVSTIQKSEKNELIVSETNIILEGSYEDYPLEIFKTPGFFTWFLFIIVLFTSLINIKKKKVKYWIDYLVFGIIGFLGTFLLIVWIITEHEVLKQNLNIIWAFPLHLIVVFFLRSLKFKKILKYYFITFSIIYTLFLLSWFFLPQQLHIAIIPVVLIALVRSIRLYINYK